MVEVIKSKIEEKKKKLDWRILVAARKALDSVWEGPLFGCRGRCSGKAHAGENFQQGTHINVNSLDGEFTVDIFQDPNTGELIIQEYQRVERTPLGDSIRAEFEKNGFNYKEFLKK